MNRLTTTGLVLTGLGSVGYSAGIAVAYSGRAFSITAIMIGITLLAIGRSIGRAVAE